MTTMIERIARGLATADNRGDDWQQYTDKAVGTLLLMRDPTEAMLAAGPPEPYMDAGVWRGMIDAALFER